jgi:hypothetical protein
VTCESIRLGDGTVAIMCSRGQRRPRCSVPGCSAPSEFQCDEPVVRRGRPGTCDAHLCAAHRTWVTLPRDAFAELFEEPAVAIDVCPPHHAARARKASP